MKFRRLSFKNKNNMRPLFYSLLLTFISIPSVNAATYNYYFSGDATGSAMGNDTTGDGSIGNPWKTLTKAQAVINALNSSDMVNLYFDRGDTWNFDTGKTDNFTVGLDDPVVNIDAYGIGNRPIFDGNITDGDFSAVNYHGTNGYYHYKTAFTFRKENCSMKNVEIQNIYGCAIRVGSNFTFSGNSVHNIGYGAVAKVSNYVATGNIIENNLIHTCQELYREGKVNWWGGAIQIYCDGGNCGDFYDNIIRYNVVYDIYGEGIMCSGNICEYNVVGDTGSIGLYPTPSSM